MVVIVCWGGRCLHDDEDSSKDAEEPNPGEPADMGELADTREERHDGRRDERPVHGAH